MPDADAHKFVGDAVKLSLQATKDYVAGTLSLNAIASAIGIRAAKDFKPGEVRNAEAEAFCILVMAA